ncbi:MAG: bifunctional diaminohydroxyphosphoribosylaminopyrimidine deaminase/5-amino-6-(5-phosphoribosylamino)uracil reductase RibD [Actinomycetota bacterium]|nr:bifunctional diaminohydroxyphosphoribosylaminopyrimidine deaminase/5-amino-6-(5-phosphoribosylamino)uracil reductase RibD [Actinomycetota bacterium]
MQQVELMHRALSLSEKGLGLTCPNPIVGAVIVNASGEFISEGFHQRVASPDHAEVVAIKSAHVPLTGATMYVTLEPCNHIGATPPCTAAIIDAGISRVVVAHKDPHALASGGIKKLSDAGIDVEVGLLSKEVAFSNRSWLHKIATGRPRIIWKIALSQDGKILEGEGSPSWVSSEESRADVQILRSQSDAIVVGTGTALVDNPHLNPRLESIVKNPDRIVIGMRDIPATFNLHDQSATTHFIKERDLEKVISTISDHGYNQVLLECGPELGNAFIQAGYLDELITYRSPHNLGTAGRDVFVGGVQLPEPSGFSIEKISESAIGVDTKSHYLLERKAG